MVRIRILFVLAVGFWSLEAAAQESASPIKAFAPPAEDEQPFSQDIAEEWLKRYAERQILFHEKDIVSLRESVANMSTLEAERWLKDTEEFRFRLDHPSWSDTRGWFRHFQAVQMRIPDGQVIWFRDETPKMSVQQLMIVMDELQGQHMLAMQRRSLQEDVRRQALADNQVLRQRHVTSFSVGGNFQEDSFPSSIRRREPRSLSIYVRPFGISSSLARALARRSVFFR